MTDFTPQFQLWMMKQEGMSYPEACNVYDVLMYSH